MNPKTIKLNSEAAKKFLENLYKPQPPNSILKKAAEDYKKAIEEGLIISKDEEEEESDNAK